MARKAQCPVRLIGKWNKPYSNGQLLKVPLAVAHQMFKRKWAEPAE